MLRSPSAARTTVYTGGRLDHLLRSYYAATLVFSTQSMATTFVFNTQSMLHDERRPNYDSWHLPELTSSTHHRTRSHRTACPGSASATAHTDSGRQSANDIESTAVHKRQLTRSVATFVITTRVEAAG